MELIGTGNTADVYAAKNNTVYKLFRKGYPADAVQREYKNSRLINSLGILSPKAHRLVTCDGKNGIVYDRLYGQNLLELMMQQDDSSDLVEKMCVLQKRILAHHSTQCINYKDFFRCLLYGKNADNSVYQLIDSLPDGTNVCHGDFHPGNVLIQNNGDFAVIDFMNVCYAPQEYDIARTYYLIVKTALSNEMPESQRRRIQDLKIRTGNQYLLCMQQTESHLQPYLDVIAEFRRYES